MKKMKRIFIAWSLLFTLVLSAGCRIFAVENSLQLPGCEVIEVKNLDRLPSAIGKEIVNSKNLVSKLVKNSKNNIKYIVKNTTRQGIENWVIIFMVNLCLYVAIKVANSQVSQYMVLDDGGYCKQFNSCMIDFVKKISLTDSARS